MRGGLEDQAPDAQNDQHRVERELGQSVLVGLPPCARVARVGRVDDFDRRRQDLREGPAHGAARVLGLLGVEQSALGRERLRVDGGGREEERHHVRDARGGSGGLGEEREEGVDAFFSFVCFLCRRGEEKEGKGERENERGKKGTRKGKK